MRHTVLDHVMGKEKQSCLPTSTSMDERPDTPQDEMTPWISTSVDLLWCIYEICRRLVSLEKESVYLTVVRHPGSCTLTNTTDESKAKLESSSSNRSTSSQVKCPELLVDPHPLLKISHIKAKDLVLSVGMRENYDLAARASRYSSERLFWGRIFSESILYNLEFTMTVRPSHLLSCLSLSSVHTSGTAWPILPGHRREEGGKEEEELDRRFSLGS